MDEKLKILIHKKKRKKNWKKNSLFFRKSLIFLDLNNIKYLMAGYSCEQYCSMIKNTTHPEAQVNIDIIFQLELDFSVNKYTYYIKT